MWTASHKILKCEVCHQHRYCLCSYMNKWRLVLMRNGLRCFKSHQICLRKNPQLLTCFMFLLWRTLLMFFLRSTLLFSCVLRAASPRVYHNASVYCIARMCGTSRVHSRFTIYIFFLFVLKFSFFPLHFEFQGCFRLNVISHLCNLRHYDSEIAFKFLKNIKKFSVKFVDIFS